MEIESCIQIPLTVLYCYSQCQWHQNCVPTEQNSLLKMQIYTIHPEFFNKVRI